MKSENPPISSDKSEKNSKIAQFFDVFQSDAPLSDLSDYNRTKSDKSEKMALFSSFRPYFLHPIISDAQLSDLVRFKSDKSENVFWLKSRFFPHWQNHLSWHIPSWVPCMCTYNKACDTPYLIGSRFCVNLIQHILSSDFSDFSEKIGCIRHSDCSTVHRWVVERGPEKRGNRAHSAARSKLHFPFSRPPVELL